MLLGAVPCDSSGTLPFILVDCAGSGTWKTVSVGNIAVLLTLSATSAYFALDFWPSASQVLLFLRRIPKGQRPTWGIY